MENRRARILTINGGSSSIKVGVFEPGARPRRILTGGIDRIGKASARFRIRCPDQRPLVDRVVYAPDQGAAAEILIEWLVEWITGTNLAGIGHRVVHGGADYVGEQLIDDSLLKTLRSFVPFDREHLPAEIRLIEIFRKGFPDVPQVACFDTAFHHAMPEPAQMLPIPRRYRDKGVRRYGFHGLSCAFLIEELGRRAGKSVADGKVILAHLGSGASLTALCGGKSQDTSMGFTPTGGFPMGTRSGDLDPGLLWYLSRSEGMSGDDLNRMLNFESGLLGISETSGDMEDLLACEAYDCRSALAVTLFCYQVRKWIGAFAAVLGGLDALVFSAGIGENAGTVRARICEGLGFLGVTVDPVANAASHEIISAPSSDVSVWVIPTDEELMIATLVSRSLQLN